MEQRFFTRFLLLLSIRSVIGNGPPKFNSIKELKDGLTSDDGFGKRFPRHGIPLLFFLANITEFDNNNNNIMNFRCEPNRRDYGFHRYRHEVDPNDNEETTWRKQRMTRLIEATQQNRYYILGHLHTNANTPADIDARTALPEYVRQAYYNTRGTRRSTNNDRDRILVSGRQIDGRFRVRRLLITQHFNRYELGTAYDADNTFEITPNLIREISIFLDITDATPATFRRFGLSVTESELDDIRNKWGDLAGLILLLMILLDREEVGEFCRSLGGPGKGGPPPDGRSASRTSTSNNNKMNLNVKSQKSNTSSRDSYMSNKRYGNGNARMEWSNIPEDLLGPGVMVFLFENNESEKILDYVAVSDKASGSYDTPVPLNRGLQLRLHEVNESSASLIGQEIWRGPEFNDSNGELPVNIKNHDASLKLFVKDGMACARLYIKKSFTDWKSKCHKSWVGFYSDENKSTPQYSAREYAVNFIKEIDPEGEGKEGTEDESGYDTYMYKSNMAVFPGVQARFMLTETGDEMARTPAWERPALDDGEIPVDIPGFNTKVQLFESDGMVGARLYVSKTFTDWRSKFHNSWVGFYASEDKCSRQYTMAHRAVDFSLECRSDIEEYDVYVHKSIMPIKPGVQLRFLLEKDRCEMARTKQWTGRHSRRCVAVCPRCGMQHPSFIGLLSV